MFTGADYRPSATLVNLEMVQLKLKETTIITRETPLLLFI
jgi:hypothetical protein